jgi:protein TonB
MPQGAHEPVLPAPVSIHPALDPEPAPRPAGTPRPVRLGALTPDAPRPPAHAPAVGGAAVVAFEKQLFAHVERYRRYPEAAQRDGLQGVVQVMFAMSRGGRVVGVWLKSSSGYAALDQEALDTVRRAEPLPPIPIELPDQLTILLPVEFSPS